MAHFIDYFEDDDDDFIKEYVNFLVPHEEGNIVHFLCIGKLAFPWSATLISNTCFAMCCVTFI